MLSLLQTNTETSMYLIYINSSNTVTKYSVLTNLVEEQGLKAEHREEAMHDTRSCKEDEHMRPLAC